MSGDQEKRILVFGYFATGDEIGLKRLRNSIALQRQLALVDIAPTKRVLSLGDPNAQISDDLASYFDEIILMNPYHIDKGGIPRLNYCALRNPVLDYAKRVEAKWLYFCDIDTVYLSYVEPDESRVFNTAKVYWQQGPGESIADSTEFIADHGDAAFSAGNSWFIIHHSILDSHRFNEELWGYTFDDTEYSMRLSKEFGGPYFTDNHVVHVFHENSLRNLDQYCYDRNQSIYCATVNRIFSGNRDSILEFDTMYCEASNEIILLSKQRDCVFSSLVGGKGTLSFANDIIVAEWPERIALFKSAPLASELVRLGSIPLDHTKSQQVIAQVTHPHWSGPLTLDFCKNRASRPEFSNSSGTFHIDGNLVKIRWKDGLLENYFVRDLSLDYHDSAS